MILFPIRYSPLPIRSVVILEALGEFVPELVTLVGDVGEALERSEARSGKKAERVAAMDH